MPIKNVGVLTSGGDAPGMNAAVRSIVRCGIAAGFNMYGIYDGFKGLLKGEIAPLNSRSVCDILSRGGTILSTARCAEFKEEEYQKKAADICREHGLDAVVVIGGDGSFRGGRALTKQGIPTICIPGTIDNDIPCSEYTIGYDTALNTAMEAIDKIRDTMTSHNRCCLIEVMGRNAGFLALNTAIATGAETVLIPEMEYDFNRDVIKPVLDGKRTGKKNHIIIVAEGVNMDVTKVAKEIEKITGVSTRAAILGHMQRGGSPTSNDRITAAQMGQKAIELLEEGKSNRIVCMNEGKISDIDVDEGLAMEKLVDQWKIELSRMLAL